MCMADNDIQRTRRGLLKTAGSALAGSVLLGPTATGSAAAADDGFEVTTLAPGWETESAAYLLGGITALDESYVST